MGRDYQSLVPPLIPVAGMFQKWTSNLIKMCHQASRHCTLAPFSASTHVSGNYGSHQKFTINQEKPQGMDKRIWKMIKFILFFCQTAVRKSNVWSGLCWCGLHPATLQTPNVSCCQISNNLHTVLSDCSYSSTEFLFNVIKWDHCSDVTFQWMNTSL